MTLLEGLGLGLVLSDRTVLAAVDVRVAAGELVALVGPSGSGKTTLLALLAGDLPPTAGTVLAGGRVLSPGDAAHTAGCGRVLQRHALVSGLTASENVELALRARGLPGRDARERAAETLSRVGLGDALDRPAARLSGGQQQRVAVARALAPRPALVLADEPTSELDEQTRDRVVDQLRREAGRGAGVLVATHDPAVAAAADRQVRLVHGRLARPDGWSRPTA